MTQGLYPRLRVEVRQRHYDTGSIPKAAGRGQIEAL